MANREALRELQSRLASRLQEARTTGAAAAWLAVEAADARYLFPLNHAGEIFPWRTVQAVRMPGIGSLASSTCAGGVSGVVDLGAFVKHAPPSHRSDLAQSQCRLVAFSDALNINCVVLIDKLLGLKSVESFVASNRPAADARSFSATAMSIRKVLRGRKSICRHFLSIPSFSASVLKSQEGCHHVRN
jgi:twitching motility protein PilI